MCHAHRSARRTAALILTLALTPSVAMAQDAAPEEEVPAGAEEAQAENHVAPADEEAPAEEAPADDGWSGEVPSDEELLAMMSERPTLETGTGITGRVVDGSTGDPIIEGAVVVIELNRRVYTNLDGYFAVDVPPGTYTLRSFYELFQPTRVSDVVVTQGSATEVTIELSPDTESVAEELVVTARADTATAATQLAIRRESAAVRDAISSEEISRSPDSAASDAARRVVAATIVGGQYLYVRGLGGRYTNVLLDGALIPQLDPDTPGVQLDMFPANLLSSLSILKSYSPDLPGAFGGGTMFLETRDFPNDFEIGASVGLGVTSGMTFRDALVYEGGSLDWLGFDDGTRSLPGGVPDRRVDGGELSRDELEAVGRTFPNVWALQPETVLPDFKLGFHMGDTLTVGDRFLGYLFAFGYSRETDFYDDFQIRTVSNGGEEARDELVRQSSEHSVLWSALGTATLEMADGQELTLTTLYNQSADDYAGFQRGYDDARGTDVASRRLRWVERSLLFTQLSGDHREVFETSRFRWRLNLAVGGRDEPDTRDLLYDDRMDGTFVWVDRDPTDGQRLYSNLSQLDFGGAVELESPILGASVKVGAAFNRSDREYQLRRFTLDRNTRADPANFTLAPEDLFRPENVGPVFRYNEITTEDDGYEAEQDLYAAFAMLEVPVTDRLRAMAGIRAEAFRQQLIPSSPFARQTTEMRDDIVFRTDVDLLPAASLVFELADDMYVRAAYSATVARPQIRELSESVYSDFVRRRTLYGDPDLTRTLIQNVDLRWELFPGETEVLAVSGFVKLFDDPIELVILDHNYTVSYQNIEGARNYGAELEARFSLGRLNDALEAFSVNGNLTLVLSEAELTEEQARVASSSERPLAGQSPYVANLSLGFAPPDSTLGLYLYYNVFGRRIEEVGIEPLPDTYQQPFLSLDLIVQWDIDEHLTLKGAVKNMLFDEHVLVQGDYVVERYSPGMSASVSLGWSN